MCQIYNIPDIRTFSVVEFTYVEKRAQVRGEDMKKITKETIEYLSDLAKLSLTEEEKARVESDMNQLLEYVEMLQEIDTRDVKPLLQVLEYENVFREDEITNLSGDKQTLKNAPSTKEGLFVVPRTIE